MGIGHHENPDAVIEDSEEEREHAKGFPALTTKQQLQTNAVSSISDFTTIAHGARSDEIVPHSIADRAKTRQRTQGTKPPVVRDDDVIEITSEDDVEKDPKSSVRPIKPKPKAKVKAAEKPLPVTSSVTTNSHIDSEQPPVRARPRPRLITNKAPGKLNSDSLPPHRYPFARDPLLYDMPGIQPQVTNQAMATGIVSQLPPSDPPTSTMTTVTVEQSSRPEDGGLPPIEILQEGESDRDVDKLLSSPGSLFSDKGRRPKAKLKKRKREALDIQDNADEVDQLQPSSPYRNGPSCANPSVLNAETHWPEPPPTFFAGSSSSASRHDGQRNLNAFSEPQTEVIDLTDLPLTIDCAKPSKLNKKKTGKVNTETEPRVVLGGDDSDFNPSGKKTAKKRKGKEKEPLKEKENKPKEKRTRKKTEQLDGVVLQARAKTGKAKAKEKHIEKEVFKSREIIEDSDEDIDPLLLVGVVQVDGVPLPSTTNGISQPQITDLNQCGISSARGQSSGSKVGEPNSSASASAGSTEKTTSRGKKRKSIVECEEDGSEKKIQDDDCIMVKRRKPASGANLSDDKVEPERVDSGKDKPTDQKFPRRTGVSKAIISDDESEDRGSKTSGTRQGGTMQMNSKGDRRTTVDKENICHTPGPSVASAVRPLASRASTITPDISTPLYARYEVAPRRSSLPMSELIRRASAKPGSPFPVSFTPSHQGRNKGKRPDLAETQCSASATLTTYSPYLKMSRRALSKIAPLHLNRKTPPPPAPPPPAKKKTKKELEREEKWEEELVDSVGGIEVWASMEDSERKQMKRAKREMEMGGYDD